MTSRFARRCLVGAGALLLALLAATSRARAGDVLRGGGEGRARLRLQHQGQLGALQGLRRDGHRAHAPQRGPNGETVYADNETALELYFFKHGIKDTVARPASARAAHRVARRQDAHHARQQLLHGDVEPHPAALHVRDAGRLGHAARHRGGGRRQGPASASGARSSSSRAGSTSPRWSTSSRPTGRTSSTRPPARSSRTPTSTGTSPRRRRSASSFGQFKAPFGRQQLTSSGAQQFVDRAIQDARYNDGARDRHRALGHARHQQARLARHGLERQRPQPDA